MNWTFSFGPGALEFLNEGDTAAQICLQYLITLVENGAGFVENEYFREHISKFVGLGDKLRPFERRGIIDSANNSVNLTTNEILTLYDLVRSELTNLTSSTKFDVTERSEFSNFSGFMEKFLLPYDAKFWICIIDPYLFVNEQKIDSNKVNIVYKMLDMLGSYRNCISLKRELLFLYNSGVHKCVEDEIYENIKSMQTNLDIANDIYLYFYRCSNRNLLHDRYLLFPYWFVRLKRGVHDIRVNEEGIFLDNKPIQLRPYPTPYPQIHGGGVMYDRRKVNFNMSNFDDLLEINAYAEFMNKRPPYKVLKWDAKNKRFDEIEGHKNESLQYV